MATQSSTTNILIVDEDKNLIEAIKIRLEAEGYCVTTAGNPADAESIVLGSPFDLALVDLRIAEESSIDLMMKLHQINPETLIVIMTAYGTIDSAFEAIQKGARGYIKKPFEHRDLVDQIADILEQKSHLKNATVLSNLMEKKIGFEGLVWKSNKMQHVLNQVAKAAVSDSSVYIQGESGTGKELIARILHYASPRRNKPFIVINCAAIPETLFESELFGYEKGAFTGANFKKQGFFTQAHGGSFFMDEISEIPKSMQTKLLRAVQEGEFYPLGSSKVVSVDTRLISTSNKDLKNEVEKGRFREDLFYRIHVVPIKLPPLRERKEDIPLLADFFLKRYARKNNKNIKGFSIGAFQMMSLYNWPGNIRQLKNEVESAVIMAKNDVITEDVILNHHNDHFESLKPYKEAKADFEKQYLIQLMDYAQGNVSMAASLSGKYRADLYPMIKRHGLNPSDFRKSKG